MKTAPEKESSKQIIPDFNFLCLYTILSPITLKACSAEPMRKICDEKP
jgi:hypothetical protein